MATFRLRGVVKAETDGYVFKRTGRRLMVRLNLSCGHQVWRRERLRRGFEGKRVRCYDCGDAGEPDDSDDWNAYRV